MNVVIAAIWLSIASIGWLVPGTAWAGLRAADLVRAELLAEPDAIRPGETFTLGIRLTAQPGWHTYWINPGDSGIATDVAWTLPPGFQAGPLQWPAPERIPVNDLMNYGYDGEVMLLARLKSPPELAAGTTVPVAASVTFLVCREECIPGSAKLSLHLPAAAASTGSPATGRRAAEFETARARLPVPVPHRVTTRIDGTTIGLRVEAADPSGGAVRSAYFYPFDDAAIDHGAPQVLTADASGFSLDLKRASGPDSKPPVLDGVLSVEMAGAGGPEIVAWQIGQPPLPASVPISEAQVPQVPPAEVAEPPTRTEPPTIVTVALAALAACLGGLLLNLMPCVFPVLSIKALALVRYGGHTPGRVRAHGLAYGCGVVGTFVALAIALIAARAGGAEVGWGFQLQSPLFVALLAALLFAMGLGLSGATVFGGRLTALAGRAPERSGLVGSALTGVLATVVATPCTAPFMGAAVGFALSADAPVAVTIFVALGLGMAAPFVALTFWPGLIARLPRPGAWMETLKQALAFPLYATAAWLVFVLAQEVGPNGLLAALIGLVLVAFALWAFGLAGTREGRGRMTAWTAVGLAAVALVGVGIAIDQDRTSGPAVEQAQGSAEAFTQARLDGLRAQGRPVFVDMTAAWCITCLVNERTALASDVVRARMKTGNVAYLRGDWTRQNPEITRLLERHGRSGVPLYLVYPIAGDAIVLPQLLTTATVLDGIDQATAARGAPIKRAGTERSTLQ